jgi:AraC-like DNA-binding protein
LADFEQTALYESAADRYIADNCAALVEAVERNEVQLGALVHGQYPGKCLENEVIPEVLSIGSWNDRGAGKWSLARHRNEGIEFTFVENGTLSFSTDNQSYALEPNSMTITRPWQAHQVGTAFMRANKLVWLILDVGVRRPNEPWIWPHWVVIDPPLLDELTQYIRQNETPVWTSAKKLRPCFAEFSRLAGIEPTSDTQIQLIKIKINEMLLSLLEHFRWQEPELSVDLTSNEHAVRVFLDRLVEDPSDVSNLDDMARKCGISVSSFTYYCRKLTNMTPVEFHTKARIERAKGLLGDKKLSILDVALEVGFTSAQYFSTVFRRIQGITPSDYRRSGIAS